MRSDELQSVCPCIRTGANRRDNMDCSPGETDTEETMTYSAFDKNGSKPDKPTGHALAIPRDHSVHMR